MLCGRVSIICMSTATCRSRGIIYSAASSCLRLKHDVAAPGTSSSNEVGSAQNSDAIQQKETSQTHVATEKSIEEKKPPWRGQFSKLSEAVFDKNDKLTWQKNLYDRHRLGIVTTADLLKVMQLEREKAGAIVNSDSPSSVDQSGSLEGLMFTDEYLRAEVDRLNLELYEREKYYSRLNLSNPIRVFMLSLLLISACTMFAIGKKNEGMKIATEELQAKVDEYERLLKIR